MNLARRKPTPIPLRHHPPPPPPPSPPPRPSSPLDRIAKLINDHPFPSSPLHPLLSLHLRPPTLTPSLLESLLTRLFAGHSHGLKSLELLRFALPLLPSPPTPNSLDLALHSLTRMRDFPSAFSLLESISAAHPTLLTPRALSVLLSRHAKFRSFDDTLSAFEQAEHIWLRAGVPFGTAEFNALLRAFCAQSRVAEARAVFNRLHHRFPPNARTLNTLLLGFKESRNITAFDLFYHDTTLRGFAPDAVTYNIRIDAYCKNRRFSDALALLDEMRNKNLAPTVQTITTLIHGAGIVRNAFRARELFDGMGERGLMPDRGAYNALMGALLRGGDFKAGVELMEEMEEKEFGVDDVTYYTLFCAMKRYGGVGDVCKLYRRMVERNYVPRPRTVMLLMKLFCENRWSGLGLELWDYLVERGCCPHVHALDLLVTALCCSDKVPEAYRCFKQMVERGRLPAERGFRVLERFLMRSGGSEKLEELNLMMSRLSSPLPTS